MLLLFYANGWV